MKLFFLAKTLFLTLLVSFMLTGTASAFTEFDGTQTTIEKQVGKGKWTLIEVWASDCGACRKHMPEMVEFDGKMENLEIVGIALDGQPGKHKAKAMIDEYKMGFKNIISNPIEFNAWMEYNAEESLIGTPTFLIFNPQGELVAAQPGIISVASVEKFIKSKS